MPPAQRESGAGRGRRWRIMRGRNKAAHDTGQPLGEALRGLLEAMGGTPERAGLQNLWDNWEAALGADLAALARPLGHRAAHAPADGQQAEAPGRGAVLLLGAGDAMLLQELRFRSEEILARVNGFLGRPYFSEVQVQLPLGRREPVRTRPREKRPGAPEAGAPARGPSGVFLKAMDLASPVARCYARFAGLRSGGGAPEDAGQPDKEKIKNN